MNQANPAEPRPTVTPLLIAPQDAEGSAGHHSSALRRLAIVREMLSDLDTLTLAGQRYAMMKIMTFFEGQSASAPMSGRTRFLIAHLLHQLIVENQRPCPDARRFRRHAEGVIILLSRCG